MELVQASCCVGFVHRGVDGAEVASHLVPISSAGKPKSVSVNRPWEPVFRMVA
jgi:hypothetical protein